MGQSQKHEDQTSQLRRTSRLDGEVRILERALAPFRILGREELAREAHVSHWHEGTFEAALRAGVDQGALKLLPQGYVGLRRPEDREASLDL